MHNISQDFRYRYCPKFGRHKFTCRLAYVAIVPDFIAFFQVRDL